MAVLPNLQLQSWKDERLPEILWAALIISHFEQASALRYCGPPRDTRGERQRPEANGRIWTQIRRRCDVQDDMIASAPGIMMGKPVIAGHSGGAVYAVEDGVSGFSVDPTDPESLENAIRQLLDPEKRRVMGQAGIEFAERFSWDRSAEILKRYL